MTADLQLQLDVLAEVLREDPDVLTLQALADRVLANPPRPDRGHGARPRPPRARQRGLVISDGLLVRASRPALHFKRMIASLSDEVERSAL